MPGEDGQENALNDPLHLFVEQQQFFEAPLKDVDSVLEIGLALRRILVGCRK
jgi:hypothetical protein